MSLFKCPNCKNIISANYVPKCDCLKLSEKEEVCQHDWVNRTDGYEEQCGAAICTKCGKYGCWCDVGYLKMSKEEKEDFGKRGISGNDHEIKKRNRFTRLYMSMCVEKQNGFEEKVGEKDIVSLINECLGLVYDNSHPMPKASISNLLAKIKARLEDTEKELEEYKEKWRAEGCRFREQKQISKEQSNRIAELEKENQENRMIILRFDNYCRVNDIDMEQFLKE
jgi:hypothetical protein